MKAQQPLTLRSKLLYSIGGLGSEALNQSRNVWLIFFYAPPGDAEHEGLLRLATVTILLSLGRFLEAFDDTLIGWWSDRTRSRWGRRVPFIVLGTPGWALAAILMFTPPSSSSSVAIAAYFFVTLQLYHLFATLSVGPYDALLPELARSSRRRVELSGLRVYFGVGGAAVGLIASGLLVDLAGFRWMAIFMATLMLATRYIGILGVWQQATESKSVSDLPLRTSIRLVISSRPFLAFLPSMVAYQLSLALLTGVLPFFVVATIQPTDEGVWVAILTATSIVTMSAAIPAFARYANRTSKQSAYRAGMVASALAFQTVFVAGHLPGIEPSVQAVIMMAIVGAPVAGVFLFPGPIIADICDDDARRTGLRREATFFGGQVFAEKTVGALAPLILGLLLVLGRSAENPLGIRLVGPVAGLIVFGGYLAFRSYDLADDIASHQADSIPASYDG